jgi:hypothetical protein
MATTIKLKSSSVAGQAPTTINLDLRELAINTYDGKLFVKKDDGAESIVDLHQRSVDEAVAEALALAIALG